MNRFGAKTHHRNNHVKIHWACRVGWYAVGLSGEPEQRLGQLVADEPQPDAERRARGRRAARAVAALTPGCAQRSVERRDQEAVSNVHGPGQHGLQLVRRRPVCDALVCDPDQRGAPRSSGRWWSPRGDTARSVANTSVGRRVRRRTRGPVIQCASCMARSPAAPASSPCFMPSIRTCMAGSLHRVFPDRERWDECIRSTDANVRLSRGSRSAPHSTRAQPGRAHRTGFAGDSRTGSDQSRCERVFWYSRTRAINIRAATETRAGRSCSARALVRTGRDFTRSTSGPSSAARAHPPGILRWYRELSCVEGRWRSLYWRPLISRTAAVAMIAPAASMTAVRATRTAVAGAGRCGARRSG